MTLCITNPFATGRTNSGMLLCASFRFHNRNFLNIIIYHNIFRFKFKRSLRNARCSTAMTRSSEILPKDIFQTCEDVSRLLGCERVNLRIGDPNRSGRVIGKIGTSLVDRVRTRRIECTAYVQTPRRCAGRRRPRYIPTLPCPPSARTTGGYYVL